MNLKINIEFKLISEFII